MIAWMSQTSLFISARKINYSNGKRSFSTSKIMLMLTWCLKFNYGGAEITLGNPNPGSYQIGCYSKC